MSTLPPDALLIRGLRKSPLALAARPRSRPQLQSESVTPRIAVAL